MRFGLFFQAPEATGQTHAERYAEMFDLIALADSLGFDVAWLAELHFGGAFSLLANPLMTVPVIAQRTRRIRIGTAVVLGGLFVYRALRLWRERTPALAVSLFKFSIAYLALLFAAVAADVALPVR